MVSENFPVTFKIRRCPLVLLSEILILDFGVEVARFTQRLRLRAWEEFKLRPRPRTDERRREEPGASIDRDGRDSHSISSLVDIVRERST
jgi:hypothetical protein